MDSHKYIAYFDSNGFELVYNITARESEYIMATLRDEQYRLPFNLDMLMLRARMNPQRFPEIWIFNVDVEIAESEVQRMSEENPQYLADFIRANGKNLYGRSTAEERAPVIR